jgi:hypothetical protein
MRKLLISLFFFLLLVAAVYAGDIADVRFSPSEPKILEELKMEIKIKNTRPLTNAYSLSTLIVKDGLVKYENEIGFTLTPNSEITLTPNYVPEEIGTYNVVIKLLDKYKTYLFDSWLGSFYVTSDYGPFDLYLDLPSYTVEPGSKLPVLVNLANRGTNGTDVDVNISIECFTPLPVRSSFVYYLEPNSTAQKLVYIPVCNEVGMHTLVGYISIGSVILVTSSAQVNINHTVSKLLMLFPDVFNVGQNSTGSFAAQVKNVGTTEVRNVKFFMGNIPKEWVEITPEKVDVLKPEESAYFFIKITIPPDANVMIYPLTITAAGEGTVLNEQSALNVLQGAFIEHEHPVAIDVHKYYYVVVAVVLLLIIVVVVLKRKTYDRKQVLEKIKTSIS